MVKKTKITILWVLVLVGFLFVFINFPNAYPQPKRYHDFSDARSSLGILNFWNVVSNISFLGVCFFGVLKIKNTSFNYWEKINAQCLILGIGLTCFGSAYYHWNPTNVTLIWDRIPMVLVFMPFLSFILARYVNPKNMRGYFLVFTSVGVLSVLYWGYSEAMGYGDLRPYGLVQFLPMLIIPSVLLLFFKKGYHTAYSIPIFVFYGLAKVLEAYDAEVFNVFNQTISGHSLKHIAAAIATYYIIRWITKPIVISDQR